MAYVGRSVGRSVVRSSHLNYSQMAERAEEFGSST